MNQRTFLYEQHLEQKGKMVNFAGWEMPLHYGSQIEEHHRVRRDAGVFDVSHMGPVDILGNEAKAFLSYLLANNVERLYPEKALYTCMLNEQGGIIDDLIVYQLEPHYYRVVVNAATRQKDLAWIRQQAEKFSVDIKERTDLAILAVQGPQAQLKLSQVLSPQQHALLETLKPFHCLRLDLGLSKATEHTLLARTGYTGEAGFELMMPGTDAPLFWQRLLDAGVYPCGLAARDTLRLEAGLNLYGSDMDETTTPMESNLGWTVSFDPPDRDFIGRLALEKQQQHVKRCLVGLVLEERGILRSHQKVIAEGVGTGEVTSGTFSPTLNHSIALARVPVGIGDSCHVMMRDKPVPVRVVKPPFVRKGKSTLSA